MNKYTFHNLEDTLDEYWQDPERVARGLSRDREACVIVCEHCGTENTIYSQYKASEPEYWTEVVLECKKCNAFLKTEIAVN